MSLKKENIPDNYILRFKFYEYVIHAVVYYKNVCVSCHEDSESLSLNMSCHLITILFLFEALQTCGVVTNDRKLT